MIKKFITVFLALSLTLTITASAKNILSKKIPANFLAQDKEAQAELINYWNDITDKNNNERLFICSESNTIFVSGEPEHIDLIEKIIKSLDRQPQQIRLDMTIIQTDNSADFLEAINYSGIYNRLNTIVKSLKNFDFIGLGGLITDIPTPESPISPTDGNLYVNPDTLSIDLSTGAETVINVLAQFEPAVNIPIVFGGPDLNTKRLNLILKAQEDNQSINLVSRPTLTVKNGETAKLMIGQSLPYYIKEIKPISQAVTTETILTYQNMGTSVSIVPNILKNKMIKIKLYINNTQILGGSSQTNPNGLLPQPPFLQSIKSGNDIILKDGETKVMFSSTSNIRQTATSKVPKIADIPLIGKFFTGKGKSYQDSNITIIITAKIVNNADLYE